MGLGWRTVVAMKIVLYFSRILHTTTFTNPRLIMLRIRTLRFLLVFFAVLPTVSFGQGYLPKFIQRLEVGYSLPSSTAEYTRHDRFVFPTTGQRFDTTVTTKANSTFSFGGSLSTYFRLKQLGRKSNLNLSTMYMYNIYAWNYKSPVASITPEGRIQYSESGLPFDGATAYMALPIGIDLKLGTDAMIDKDIRFAYTLGVGAAPSLSLTADLDNASQEFGVQPYVKAEFGLFAALCMKVRALYSFGDLTYYDYKSGSTNAFGGIETQSKLTGKGNFTLQFVVMPFSWNWRRAEWWNTY